MPHDERAVAAVLDRFEDSWNRHDMRAFAGLFAEDADFVNVFGTWWTGRDAIERAHAGAHATIFKDSRLSIERNETRFVGPDAAVVRSLWRMTGQVDPKGAAVPPRAGILINVLRRAGDAWTIVASQNTDIVAT